ncbi:hypothetical protein KUA02_01385 [Komagataeibacter pomaceti]|nr:hypothetical protein [Novacetimonas pomaceti]
MEHANMSAQSQKAWFAPKSYGYGSGLPISWEGWVVFMLFLAITILPWFALSVIHPDNTHAMEFTVCLSLVDILATVAFGYLCKSRTAGGWKWRWGKDAH